jgi:cation diffusion facilitator family transporter
MITQRCIDCSRKVLWIVLGINLGLFLLKGSFALLSHSKSLLTDSFQSLANFIITIVVLASLRMASKGADEKFPYGYGKVEFLASGLVNMLLMIAAIVFICVSFIEMIMVAPEKPPKLIAILAAGISIIANYIAFGYGRCAGEKLASTAILANAEVSRADVGTSVAVIVAVVGSNLGFSRLDHIAAIVICLLIIKVTLDGVKKAIKGLMDASLRSEELHIRNLIEDIKGVRCVGDVKVRFAGRSLWVDVNIFVPADWVLSRSLETVQKIKNVLRKKMKDISDVSVQLLPFISADDHGHRIRYRSENIKRE